MEHPRVTVIIPTLDEAAAIDDCMASLHGQDLAEPWDIVVADGGSTDGTLEKIERWRDRLTITIVDNRARVQSEGLNRAAAIARGEFLVRADAHTTYAPDYVRRSVEVLTETAAAAAGGPMVPEGTTPFGRAVAAAMQSPLAIGPGKFHHAEERQEADTVYLGAFRRAEFLGHGGYRTLPNLVAEDADLYFRIRRAGGLVLVDPSIRSTYRPRETVSGLWRQFWRYGAGKADMLYLNRRWPSWRPLAPLLLVLGLLAGAVIAAVAAWWPLAGILAAWTAVLLVAGRGRPLVVLAAAVMHLAYGCGLIRGLLRSPSSVRRTVSR